MHIVSPIQEMPIQPTRRKPFLRPCESCDEPTRRRGATSRLPSRSIQAIAANGPCVSRGPARGPAAFLFLHGRLQQSTDATIQRLADRSAKQTAKDERRSRAVESNLQRRALPRLRSPNTTRRRDRILCDAKPDEIELAAQRRLATRSRC